MSGDVSRMREGVRRLGTADARALMTLRRAALTSEPLAFVASVEDDVGLVAASVERFLADRDEQAVFGAFEGDELVAMIGVVRAAKTKQRHRATVWGTFVLPQARGRGLGGALVAAVVAQARTWGLAQLMLGVTDAAPAARRLYERAGFRTWGREPRALQSDGRFVDEEHLALDLC